MRPVSLMVCAFLLVACTPAASPSAAPGRIEVRAVASPVCPVETVPADPACQPRAVAGAPIVVTAADGSGRVVAQGTTDAGGIVRFDLPPGDYVISGGDVAGLMGLPPPMPVSVGSEPASVTLAYDTGIR